MFCHHNVRTSYQERLDEEVGPKGHDQELEEKIFRVEPRSNNLLRERTQRISFRRLLEGV